jgi:hypothetical protein
MPEEVIRASERAGIEYAKAKEEIDEKDTIKKSNLLEDIYEKD